MSYDPSTIGAPPHVCGDAVWAIVHEAEEGLVPEDPLLVAVGRELHQRPSQILLQWEESAKHGSQPAQKLEEGRGGDKL